MACTQAPRVTPAHRDSLGGPAQVVEVYSEDGLERPFYISLNTPFEGNVVKITNTGPVEFPLTATVVRPRFRAISASRSCAGTQTAELSLRTVPVRILMEVF